MLSSVYASFGQLLKVCTSLPIIIHYICY